MVINPWTGATPAAQPCQDVRLQVDHRFLARSNTALVVEPPVKGRLTMGKTAHGSPAGELSTIFQRVRRDDEDRTIPAHRGEGKPTAPPGRGHKNNRGAGERQRHVRFDAGRQKSGRQPPVAPAPCTAGRGGRGGVRQRAPPRAGRPAAPSSSSVPTYQRMPTAAGVLASSTRTVPAGRERERAPQPRQRQTTRQERRNGGTNGTSVARRWSTVSEATSAAAPP